MNSKREKMIDKVFVYGDSISMQYGFALEKILKKLGIKYDRLGGCNSMDLANPLYNGLSSREMIIWLKNSIEFPETVLLFNCGLHDIIHKKIDEFCYVDLNEYIDNLQKILELARKKFEKIVFCTTTLVNDIRHNKNIIQRFRYNDDVIAYNHAARTVMQNNDIPVIDLYELMAKSENYEELFIDHVHVTRIMAECFAEKIVECCMEAKIIYDQS